MEKYVGFDVHAATTSYCVRDSKGKVVAEGVVETGAAELSSLVKSIVGTIHLAFEEGTQAAWLYDLLEPLVAELVVCDPRKFRKDGNKNDRVDARKLSRLLRMGELSAVYHGEHGTRGLKEHVRAHRDTVRDLVRVKNRIKAGFRGRGIDVSGAKVYHPDKREAYLSRVEFVPLVRRIRWLYEEMDKLEELRKQTESAMVKESRKHRGCRILKKVPGLGDIRSAQIVGSVDTPHRFRTKRPFWTYVGLSVVTHSSSDWVRGPDGITRRQWQVTRGLNRNCNYFLKSVFKSAAKDAVAFHDEWTSYFDGLLARGLRPEIARVHAARKLAAISLTLWKKGERYDRSVLKRSCDA